MGGRIVPLATGNNRIVVISHFYLISIKNTTMERKTVLVAGGTGNAGYSALQCLLESSCFNVKAGIYKKSDRRGLVKELPGIQSVHEYDASYIDKNMESAFKDVDYAYLVPPRSKNRVSHIENYVKLCKKHSIKFIVLFSMMRPKQGFSQYSKDYEAMEKCVEKSGVQFSIIKSSMHQQSLFLFQPDILKGSLPLPIGNGKFAPVNICDVSRMLVKIFCDPVGHYRYIYSVTGPELVDGSQMAAIASESLGINVKFLNISSDNCKDLLMDSGLEEWLALEFVEMFSDIATGKFEIDYHQVSERITGLKALTLSAFFTAHKSRFTTIRTPHPIEDYPEGIEYSLYPKSPCVIRASAERKKALSETVAKEVSDAVSDLKLMLEKFTLLQRNIENCLIETFK
jgi:NAD(P)H dehydrogenase (quinone)